MKRWLPTGVKPRNSDERRFVTHHEAADYLPGVAYRFSFILQAKFKEIPIDAVKVKRLLKLEAFAPLLSSSCPSVCVLRNSDGLGPAAQGSMPAAMSPRWGLCSCNERSCWVGGGEGQFKTTKYGRKERNLWEVWTSQVLSGSPRAQEPHLGVICQWTVTATVFAEWQGRCPQAPVASHSSVSSWVCSFVALFLFSFSALLKICIWENKLNGG